MKIVSIIGARPQFIKAAPLSRLLRERHTEILVHTGQHYDENMSQCFFQELGIPEPEVNLGVGSGPHGRQTGAILAGIEEVLLAERPDAIVVYGDTNSTLAGALAAAKLSIPIAHVEAGLRSFNRAMPEEVNRVVTDHLSTWLFAPSEAARALLEQEGIRSGVHVVGDIMLDTLRMITQKREGGPSPCKDLGLTPGGYEVCTLHRAENTDNRERLARLLEGLGRLAGPVLLPLHPRTRARLLEHGLVLPANVRALEPLGHLDMMRLVGSARCVLTDSGGLQKEAYYLKIPCLTLRDETEWVETLDTGWNRLVGTDPDAIQRASADLPAAGHPHPALYGDGHSASLIVDILSQRSA